MGDLYGQVEHARLVDQDFSDGDLFPHMKLDQYMDYYPASNGEICMQWRTAFAPLRDETLCNLMELPVFGTSGEVARCTKFLISRVHGGSLWLDQEYPIHVDDIHLLTGLSMEGQDVTDAFQGTGKHGRRKG